MTQVNKKAKTSPIGCNWVFTWNNYNDKKAPQAWPDMAQLVYQCEICPETKTPHLQGYVRFKKNKRFSAVKALDSDKIHWELRRGTHEQARDYASKEESRDPGPLVRGSSVMILAKVIVPISMKPPRLFEKALVYRLSPQRCQVPSSAIHAAYSTTRCWSQQIAR